MTFTFRPARRENVPLLIGVAGGTGSGKTMSALLLARGLAGGEPFGAIDTENGRMLHYAELFPEMQHARLEAPFRPERYNEAIEHADSMFSVVVVDSMSHEWAGDGGCLDWHDELMGGDQKKNLASWIKPKMAHKAMVTRLLQVGAHVILCFRAEPKVEVGKDGKIIPKPSITGLNGWIPISEKMLPYELTASFLLMADAPGIPKPIKLQEQHRPMVPLDKPLSEQVGRRLGEWARGAESSGGNEPGSGLGAGSASPVKVAEGDLGAVVSAGGDAAAFPSVGAPMSAPDFKSWRESMGISREAAADEAARVFPDKSIPQLTDLDRGELRDALAVRLTREAVKA